MQHALTAICLATGVASVATAQVPQHDTKDHGKRKNGKETTVVGCLATGSQPNSFALRVPAGGNQEAIGLVGMPRADLESYVGHQVEVGGKVLPGTAGVPGATVDARLAVRYIREVAPDCRVMPVSAAAPLAAQPNANGPRNEKQRSPATSQPAASTTGTTAGLGQTGVTGSATLTWTSPTISFGPISPSAGAPLSGTSASVTPTRSAAPTGPTAPAQTTSPSAGSLPVPIAAGTTPGFAQGATSTTTSHADLAQTGISGDALLSGLVNVNVQQLLASVQLIANLNVQDVVVDVSDVLNDVQIQALVQALNTNPQAALNANSLTSALQSAGVMQPDELAVGVTGSQIYANRDLTNALQQRGIIQPSETIVRSTGPKVYKMKNK
jgi:hypothetical protein